MAYSSSSFIIYLLAGLLVYAFLPARLKVPALILMSLAWFASWELYLPLLLVPIILVHHYCALKGKLWPAVTVSVLVIFYLRIGDNPYALGSSFYMLILLAYTTDVVRRKSPALRMEETLLLGSFFPMMMAGPVERSDTFSSELRNSKVTWETVTDGMLIFAMGFLKIYFLSTPLMDLASYYAKQGGFWPVCFSSLVATLGVYISLTGFADMGRGIARSFGIQLQASFRPVIFARDPSDFWERWNRTVAGWFRDYLVFPSLLKWGRKISSNIILFAAFVCLGLWHGFELLWLLFGVSNGIIVIIGSSIRRKWGENFSGRILVLLMLMVNGLYHVYDNVFHEKKESWLDKLNHSDRIADIGITFFTGIAIFFLVEWLQEKTGENDFFLRWPGLLKKILAVFIFLLWVLMIDHRTAPSSDSLPLYFNL